MNQVLHSVAMLGGTFDPVHMGHLRSALELRERFAFDQLRFVPCHRPPHRGAPGADSRQRLHMVELALDGEPGLLADARELNRPGPSYTFDTLTELRAELGENCALTLVLGADAFAALDTWHRWRELPELAHLVVMARPDCPLPETGPVADLLRARRAEAEMLRRKPAGCIVPVALTPLPVSATQIRDIVRSGRSPRYLLPDAVCAYIREQKLYQLPACAGSARARP